MRRLWMCVLAIGVTFASASVAGAFIFSPEPIHDGVEGEVRLLWTELVDPANVGKTCDVVLVTTNNESTREGSDLIFESGARYSSPRTSNVSRCRRRIVGQLTLGLTINVSVRIGPEGQFSGGGFNVEATCPLSVVPTPTILPPIETSPSAPGSPPVPVQPTFTG